MEHETVYVVLEKDLSTLDTQVVGVYADFDLAEEVVEELMTLYEEERAYRIDVKTIA